KRALREGLLATTELRAALPLPGGALVRGRLRAAPGRSGPSRLSRIPGATAVSSRGSAQIDDRGADGARTDPEGGGPMNELGITLAWLAVQVLLLGLPSLALHALATRRGPAAGAWVAALSLGLVVVLSVSAWIPGNRRDLGG